MEAPVSQDQENLARQLADAEQRARLAEAALHERQQRSQDMIAGHVTAGIAAGTAAFGLFLKALSVTFPERFGDLEGAAKGMAAAAGYIGTASIVGYVCGYFGAFRDK